MNNIFENAYFGKPYKTRDGRKAIYFCQTERNKWHDLIVEGETISLPYQDNGLTVGNHLKYPEWPEDIVSEWQEEIDEEELMDLSCASFPCDGDTDARSFHKGFKACYRYLKAKEE